MKKGLFLSFFKRIIKILIYTIMLPIYWLSYFVPKDRNLWVFGAWFGEKYGDNSKYLFEYVNKYQPSIKAIWLTQNDDVYNLLKRKGYKVVKTYSFWGFFYTLRARVGIISTGLKDINIFTTARMQIIQLWHGTPLKKIMFDDNITFNKHTKLIKLIFYIYPFLKKSIHYSDALIISTSEEVRKILSSAFRAPIENIKITGYPRNDSFFQPYSNHLEIVKKILNLKSQGKKIAIYMPTHRKEGEVDITSLLFSNLNSIDERLKKLGCYLLVKLHYYHMNETSNISQENFSNIIFLNDGIIEQDIYNILKLTDVLITDYSSVYFDYLLTNNPIIFTPFDIESYLKNDREFYYDYNEVTPGPKAKNWDEVLLYLKEAIEYPMKNEKERKKIMNIFHKYKDGNSSKRVFDEIIMIIS